MQGLTPRQADLLAYLNSCDTTPSYVEIAGALGLAGKSSAHRLVAGLEERGFIRRTPRKARTIEVANRPAPMMVPEGSVRLIPILGRIS